MQHTSRIGRKSILLIVTLLVVLGAAGAGLKWLMPASSPASSGGPGPAVAAVAFTRAFYAIDYRDQQAWLKTLQPLATSDGYALLRSNVAGLIWPSLAQAQLVTTPDQVHVVDQGLVLEHKPVAGTSQWQIRAVSITLDGRLWPVMKSGYFSTDIMLAIDQNQWKFATFVTEEQAHAYQLAATPAP